MKKLPLTLCLIVISINLFSQTPVSGNYTGVWITSNSPYIITGNITVIDSLIIEAGVIVQFQAGTLKIEAGPGAKLIAIGTDSSRIIFEPFQGTSPGLYEGIKITDSGNDDILEYCNIRNATNGIVNYQSTPRINECIVQGCSSNGIASDVRGGHYGSKITNCVLFDNLASGINVTGYDRYGTASDTVIIDHCTIYNNVQIGILVYSGTYWNWGIAYSLAKISNCTIFKNGTGVRAYAYRGYADATITNSIVAYNYDYGVANQDVKSYITADDIIYSCFWKNDTTNFTPDIADVGFGYNGSYQNFNSDSCDVYLNIYNDPMFVDTASRDFNLQPCSKCINAGTPVINNQYVLDPDSTFPEIGAYFFDDIIAFPTANAGADTSICFNDCTDLTASGGVNNLWNTGDTNAIINVCPTITTTYTVTITDQYGCTDNDEVVVTVWPIPAADAGSDVSICQNDCAKLTASGGITYSWSSGESITTINVCPTITTTYTVTVTDMNGCTNSDEVIVTVYDLPIVDLGQDTITTCVYNTVFLDAGNPGSTYLWSTGETTQTIVVDSTGIGIGISLFTVIVTDNNGCLGYDTVYMVFDPCVSIDEVNINSKVEIFPNPAQSYLSIINKTGTELQEIVVFNINGQEMIRRQMIGNRINISMLTDGVYFVDLKTQLWSIKKKLIVVSNK